MPSYILIKAQDGWNPDDPMCWDTGYLVDVRGHSRIGGKQVPPAFIQIEITDNDDWHGLQDIYCRKWRREIDWEFVGHDYTIDGHRLRVFVKPEYVSVSGLNSLTREQVESYLNRWRASVQSVAANEVIFDATIYEAIASPGFWNRDDDILLTVQFTEMSYDQSTGIHVVEANYRNDPVLSNLDPEIIEAEIISRGGIITNHPTNKVQFAISRTTVFDIFKQDIKEKMDKTYSVREFKILPQHIQMALDNSGTLSVTHQQFAQYVYNRLND